MRPSRLLIMFFRPNSILWIDRGLELEKWFNNELKLGPNNKGYLDVVNRTTRMIYDYKFGAAVMDAEQLAKYTRNFSGYTIQIIRPQ